MDWYYYIAWLIIISQGIILALAIHNFRFALAKYKKRRAHYAPSVALLVPCKDLDADFHRNIASLFNQDYDDYRLVFIVADTGDPAYAELCKLTDQLTATSKAKDAAVLVSGKGQACSQKVHNLLYAYQKMADDVEVLAFADSDICVRPNWLRHLVHPLRLDKNGAASGYRWFVPQKNNLPTIALSAINAKVAQLLGNTRRNQAWGGSMTIKVSTFKEIKLDEIWPKTLSDDLSLSYAVKKVHKKVEFVPGCLVASYQTTTWAGLFEFTRRQFIITRIYTPATWLFGLGCMLYSVLGLWTTIALAIYAAVSRQQHVILFVGVGIIFFGAQLARAVLRQLMVRKLLAEDWPRLKLAAAADILLFWLFSPLLLIIIVSSAFGRTITWRGIKYELAGPTKTIVLHQPEQ